ncbi:PREDICTED: apoptosis-associated speck-like protein containing a CARD isoform X1 [Elephantulus edwardii]|uniref:apoptosis-associated speck-like protein containing a CARD isoform X1 n=1 Tax=Elephantulus edwardii TaxID=28737 RepID=UPI0003F0ABEE|nr:PREDICTED: apoptosis-associated speck-like protein containing a CARD isoform X1 [Elephantulus edwardii]
MGSARDAILEALENLTADELKKFKLKLLSVPLREGYGRIPRGPLLAMDAMDLTDKIVSSYLETYGAELTATVLAQMGMQEQAEQLKELSRKGAGASPALPAPARLAPLQAAARPGLHFIDEHRAALISRVTEVAGVLDALYGKVLNDEQYQAVQAECTNPLKMRKLYSYTPAWNQACKDLFLQALRATQPFLVADLEQS